MRELILYDENDLNEFCSKTSYFLDGDNGYFDKNKMPKYSFSYKKDEDQVKLAKFVKDCNLRSEFLNHLGAKISDFQSNIKRLEREIKTSENLIKMYKNRIKNCEKFNTFEEIFQYLIQKDV